MTSPKAQPETSCTFLYGLAHRLWSLVAAFCLLSFQPSLVWAQGAEATETLLILGPGPGHIVAISHAKPTVALAAPAVSETYELSDSINVSIVAGDADGPLREIALFVDGVKIESGTAQQYSLNASAVGAGLHTLHAKVWDQMGGSARTDFILFAIRSNASANLAELAIIDESGAPTTATDSDEFTLSWNAIAGATVYYLEASYDGGHTWSQVYIGADTNAELSVGVDGSIQYRLSYASTASANPIQDAQTSIQVQAFSAETPPTPAGIPSAGPDIYSDRIGSTAGQFRVNESGAATYSIPIAVVPGTAGVEPQLSFNYSSQAGNGLMGQGWSVGGLSSISRCRQTLHQDRRAMPITWSNQDRFCLDGQRLVLLNPNDSYGAPGTQYHTEIDSFARVTAVGGSAGHPDYFEVKRKDGSTSYYGGSPNDSSTADSRLSNGVGQTLVWALKEFQDSAKNPIWFVYQNEPGDQRISEVRYAYGAASSGQNAAHAAKIEFSYPGGSRADAHTRYVAGHGFGSTKLLQSVTVYGGDSAETSVRTYRLGYLGAAAGDYTARLGSVQECNGRLCLTPTTFSWPTPQAEGLGTYRTSFALQSRSYRSIFDYQMGDINGDGATDLVWQSLDQDSNDTDHQLRYALSDGTSLKNGPFSGGQSFLILDQSSNDYIQNAGAAPMRLLDYNADGRQDLAIFHRGQSRWRIFLATYTNGEWRLSSSHINTNLTQERTTFADLNSDGLVDAARVTDQGKLGVSYLEPSSSSASSATFYHFGPESIVNIAGQSGMITDDNKPTLTPAGDLNGDGQVELHLQSRLVTYEDLVYNAQWRRRTNVQLIALDGDGNAEKLIGQTFRSQSSNNIPRSRDEQFTYGDINGDGLTDVLYGEESSSSTRKVRYWINDGASFNSGLDFEDLTAESEHRYIPWKGDGTPPQLVDVNYDGYLDLTWHSATSSSFMVAYWDASAERFSTGEVLFTATTEDRDRHQLLDFDGDGWLDRAYFAWGGNGDTLRLFSSRNQGADKKVITSITNGLGAVTNITYKPLSDSSVYARLGIDTTTTRQDFCRGRGCDDIVYQTWDLAGFYSELNAAWEGEHSLGNNGGNTRKASPVLELNGPMQVVSRVGSSSPGASLDGGPVYAGAQSYIKYFYAQARLQASGRGFLGFEWLKSVDQQTGIETVTSYRQDFPFIGRPISTEVRTAGGTLLSQSMSRWLLQDFSDAWRGTVANSGTAALGPLQPVLKESTEIAYDLDSGQQLSTVVSTNIYDDYDDGDAGNYGNVTSTRVETLDGDGASVSTQTTENRYDGLGANANSRRLGRLSSTVVNHLRPTKPTITREAKFTYHITPGQPKHGLLLEEIIQPNGDPSLKLTTRYDYDQFGNQATVTTEGAVKKDGGLPNHTRTTGYVYDAYGRYVDYTVKNFGGTDYQMDKVLSRDAAGRPLQVQSVSGGSGSVASVVSTTAYGYLGRPYLTYSSDGSWSTTYYSNDVSACPPGISNFSVITQAAGGSESLTCFDKLGREVRRSSTGFAGEANKIDTHYDVLGRVYQVSEPYQSGSPPFNTNSYDPLGRIKKVERPDGLGSTISYTADRSEPGAVLRVQTTNAKLQVKSEYKNPLGELVAVTGEENSRVSYSYDATGNLLQTDAMGVVTGISYDVLGRKLSMNDPDKGVWRYKYNAFGELVEQTSANNVVTSIDYDQHGRRVLRTDTLGGVIQNRTSWTYDAHSGVRVPGALFVTDHDIFQGEEAGSHDVTLGYDGFGRLSHRQVDIDNTDVFTESFTYDQFGRPFQKHDASGDFAGVRYHYNQYGYLESISESGISTPTVDPVHYYTVDGMDARGNVTNAMLGDGTILTRDYDRNLGTLGQMTAVGMGGIVQELTLIYDELGNLKRREDYGLSKLTGNAKNVVEDFIYDGLNRLESATIAGGTQQSVLYSNRGNMESKSDVGDYDYVPGTNRLSHTTSGAGTQVSYGYDSNGNILTGDGRTIDYTSFDKPHTIQKGLSVVRFAYDGSRSRYKRTVDGESTYYVGNVEVRRLSNGTTEYTRYIEGHAIAKVTRNDVTGVRSTTSLTYQINDHLGSLDAIVDEYGNLLHDLSFDAWGARRAADSPHDIINTPVSLLTALIELTPRGYTGHEMLDTVGLIHMNGRVYDAKLGRFLSADPFVQFPANTQSYNRYSYVLNNPIGYTDSSGYLLDQLVNIAAASIGFAACGPGCAGAAVTATNLAQGASFKDALIAGVSTAAFSAIAMPEFADSAFAQAVGVGGARALAFGGVGGLSSMAYGGSFTSGFLTSALSGPLGGRLGSAFSSAVGPAAGQLLGRAVAGGTVSYLSGGKFSNGAATAAFQFIVTGLGNARASGRLNLSSVRAEGFGDWLGNTFSPIDLPRGIVTIENMDYPGYGATFVTEPVAATRMYSRVFNPLIDRPNVGMTPGNRGFRPSYGASDQVFDVLMVEMEVVLTVTTGVPAAVSSVRRFLGLSPVVKLRAVEALRRALKHGIESVSDIEVPSAPGVPRPRIPSPPARNPYEYHQRY